MIPQESLARARRALEQRGGFVNDARLKGLDVYVVGGAVRDALLGQAPGDYDWVVVGAAPEDLAARGFTPVGGDFPVFLHPVTHEEFALARTERKSGRGYKGFTFHTGVDVTLTDDLQRRDLTVNAIAWSPLQGFVDPLNGMHDLHLRVLRHVGQAFVEDPVRLLRLARFAARFPEFTVAPETHALACQLVSGGEVDALVPERVWRELAKGLMTQAPARMLQVLQGTGALERVMPGFVFDETVQAAELASAVGSDIPLPGRFALACRLSPDPAAIARHVRAPSECVDQARLLPHVLHLLASGAVAGPSVRNVPAVLECLEALDVFRKPERFMALVQAAGCAVQGVDAIFFERLVAAVRAIDAGALARSAAGEPQRIRELLRAARLEVLGGFA